MITHIDEFEGKKGTWWAKRDDLACYVGAEWPSGSKVRQFAAMMEDNPGAPVLVGCSAHSAMQIYVAAAGKLAKRKAIVYTAARAVRTNATEYARRLGAEINEERPAYLNVVQSRAAARAKTLRKGYVKWDEDGAVADAAAQVDGLWHAKGVKRVVIPTGSGLTCAGVMAGMVANSIHGIPVLAVAVSPMAQADDIKALCKKQMGDGVSKHWMPKLRVVRAVSAYDQWEAGVLPDGNYLDPYYAAKALPYVRPGDLLWLPGLRPWSAVPEKCRVAINRLRDAQGR